MCSEEERGEISSITGVAHQPTCAQTCQQAREQDMPSHGEYFGLAMASVGLSFVQAVLLVVIDLILFTYKVA